MKLKQIIGIFFMLSVTPLFALNNMQGKFDYTKFKADKIAYITEAINLTPQEAEVFWPVYNEYEEKKWALMKERRKLDRSLHDGVEEMSDEKYLELSRKLASFPLKDGKLVEEYNEKFLKILPAKKVVELYRAELNFRNHMLRNFRDDDRKKKDDDEMKD